MRDPSLTTAFVGALLLMSGAIATPALAQCSDADGDGFFYESGCGTAQDCNDGAAGTYPGATEVCDSYDNDCDGMIDNDPGCDSTCELPGKIGSELMLSNDIYGGADSSVVWTGTEYGVVFTPGDEAYFARLDASGNIIGQIVQVTNGANPGWPTLVWTGTEFGLAWTDSYEVTPTRSTSRDWTPRVTRIGGDVLVSYDPGLLGLSVPGVERDRVRVSLGRLPSWRTQIRRSTSPGLTSRATRSAMRCV